ncbi:MAG: hypothetical protein WAN35_13390 [Terracidiphilus sp.]
METSKAKWVRADFNGLFGAILCLSHKDTCIDFEGNSIFLKEGMVLTAFDEDMEDGKPDDLLASGIVDSSPEWLQCRGSRWISRIDADGVRHESDIGLV